MAVANIAPQLGCVSQYSDALVSQRGKQCQKSWDQFDEYGSLSPRYVQQVSGKTKDYRLEKYKSKFLISEVPTLWNLRTDIKKSLKDNSDAPEARHGTFPKTYTGSMRKAKLHSTRPRKNGCSRLRKQKSRRKESLWWIPERVCIWSARHTLTLLSWRQWGHQEVRRRWWRPTARCEQEKKPRCTSKNWTYSSTLCFLKKLPQFLHWGNSVRTMGIHTTGPAVKNHISPKWQEHWLQYIQLCSICRPWFIDEFLNNIHTLTSSTSSLQDYVISTDSPAAEKSRSKSAESRGNPLHKPAKIERTNKHEGDEEVQSDLLPDLPDWPRVQRELEGSCLEPRGDPSPGDAATSSSSYELPMEPRAKVEPGSGKHSVSARILRRTQNCDICLKTKITRASCRRCAGTLVPRAENFGDLIAADHKVLSEGSGSHNNHR